MAKKDFPNIRNGPSTRTYTPGEYPQAVFTAQNGAVAVIRYGILKTNTRLTLGFNNITDDDVLLILNFYEDVNSDYDHIYFSKTELKGIESGDLRDVYREIDGDDNHKVYYRFETPPVVTSVMPNRSNVQCKFVGLLDGQ